MDNEDEDFEEGELTESHPESHASSDDSPEDNGKQAVWSKKNDDSEKNGKKIKGDDQSYSEKSRSSFSRERQSDKERKQSQINEEQGQEESGIKLSSQPSRIKGENSNGNFKETVNVNSRNTNSIETKPDESQQNQKQNDTQDNTHPHSPSQAMIQGQSSSVSQQENDSNLKDRSRSRSQSLENNNEKRNKQKKKTADKRGKKKKRSVGNSLDETSSSFSYNSGNFKSNRGDNKNHLEDDSSFETDEELREEIRYIKVDQKGYKSNGNSNPKEDQKNRQNSRFSQKQQRGGRKRRSSSISRSSESASDDEVFFFKDLKGKPICSNFVQGKCLNRQTCSQSHELINYPCKFKIAQGYCDKPTQSCLFNHETDQLGKKELFRFMMDNYTFLNNLQKQKGSTKIDKKFNNFKKKRELFTDISSQDKSPSNLTQLPSCPPIQPPPPPMNQQQFRGANGPIPPSLNGQQQYPQNPHFQPHMQHRPLNGNPPPPYFQQQQQQQSQPPNGFPFYPRDGNNNPTKPPFQGPNPINPEFQIQQNYHQQPNQQQIPIQQQQPLPRQMQQFPPQNIQPGLHPHLQAGQPQYPPFKPQPSFHQNQLPSHHQPDQVSQIEQNKKPAPPQIPSQFPQYDIQPRPPQQIPFQNQQPQGPQQQPPPPPPPYYINNNNSHHHQQQPQGQKQVQQFAPNNVGNGQQLASQKEGMKQPFNQYPSNGDSQHQQHHGQQYPQNPQQPPMFSQMNGRSFDPNSQHGFQKQNGNLQANQENRYVGPPQQQLPNPYLVNSQPQQSPQNQQQFQQPLNQQKQPQFPQNNQQNGQYQPIQQYQPQQPPQMQFPPGQPPQFPAPPANYQNNNYIGQQQYLGPNQQQNVNNSQSNNYGNQGGIHNGNGNGKTNRGEFNPSMPPLGQYDRPDNNQIHQQPASPKQQKQLYSISSDQSDNRTQNEQRIKNGAEGPPFSQKNNESVLSSSPEQSTKYPPSINQVADERMKEISIFSEKEKLNAISMCQLFSRNKGNTQFSQEQVTVVLAMPQEKVQLLKAMVKSQDGEQFKQKIDEIISTKSNNAANVSQIQIDNSQSAPPRMESTSKKENLNESLLDIGIFGGTKKAATGQGQQKIIQSTGQQTKVQQILQSKVDPRLAAKEKGADKTKL